MSTHSIKIHSENKERTSVLKEEQIVEIFLKKCQDNKFNLRFRNLDQCPQFCKFRTQVISKCINRSLILQNMGLSLEFAKSFAQMMNDLSSLDYDAISYIDLSMNNLRDPGIIELASSIGNCKNLVRLNISNNSISPKGF